jgi:succinate dehydrogenase/fumarate reductase flavoprotein subunit
MRPRQLETDVLVIGSGVAGLAAALAARENSKRVFVVSKGGIAGHSCSWFAGGSLSLRLPAALTNVGISRWLAGSPLTDRSVARALAEEAPIQIRGLERYGLKVRGSKSGGYAIDNAQAGHAFSGISMITQMAESATRAGVGFRNDFTCAKLLVCDNRCLGAVGFTADEFLMISAKAVVLASGGACRMFQDTTNPPGITGDGYALLLYAGVDLVNMEFVRFFPLGLPRFRFPVHRPFRRFYDIGGLRAVNAHGEDVFQKHIGLSLQEAMEDTYCRFVTMSRIVAQERRSGEVMLDFTRVPAKIWSTFKFDGPEGLVKRWGGSAEMWRWILKNRCVRTTPIAQTSVGGARVKSNMRTRVNGLFACGEVVNFHSDLSAVPHCEIGPLPCALTSGAIAGRYAADVSKLSPTVTVAAAAREALDELQSVVADRRGNSPQPIGRRIRKIMSRHCGALRTGTSLREGLTKLDQLAPRMARFKVRGFNELSQGLEVRNMALVARAVLQAALMREESRSEHFREDFPQRNDNNWRQNIVVALDRNNMPSLSREDVRSA